MQRMDYWHLKMLYVIVLLCQCPLSSGFLDYKLNKWALRGALPGTLSQHPGTAPRKFSGVKGGRNPGKHQSPKHQEQQDCAGPPSMHPHVSSLTCTAPPSMAATSPMAMARV